MIKHELEILFLIYKRVSTGTLTLPAMHIEVHQVIWTALQKVKPVPVQSSLTLRFQIEVSWLPPCAYYIIDTNFYTNACAICWASPF